MEKGTVFGLIFGFIMIMLGMLFAAGNLVTYFDLTSVFITIGGSFCATMVAHPFSRIPYMFTLFRKVLKKYDLDVSGMVETLMTFAEKSRREGILSLEDDIDEIHNEFLRKSIQLVVDGTDPENVKSILFNEIYQMGKRHSNMYSMFIDWAEYAPAFGMIGTLVGLVAMLQNLEDTSSIGKGMAIALLTTLYGSVLANLILLPISVKLQTYSDTDTTMKEIIVEGVLSIQAGDNPAILREKLDTFIETDKRVKREEFQG